MAKKKKHEDEPEIEEDEPETEESAEPEAPEAEPQPAPEAEQPPAGEPVNPPAGSHKIIVEGDEGDPLSLSVHGEQRILPRGVEIEVGNDIMEVLEGSSVQFKKVEEK